MKSYGVEIPQSALDKVTALVETGEPFTTSEIERVLINAGVPEYHQHYPVAMRAADRIVQAWRRSGEVQRIAQTVFQYTGRLPTNEDSQRSTTWTTASASVCATNGARAMTTTTNMKPAQRWFYFKHWLRVQVCRLRGHRLETGHHLQASLFCTRCGRVQFYYHSQGLIVPASADLQYLNKLGIKNP